MIQKTRAARFGLAALAGLTAYLIFGYPSVCRQALRQGLSLCGGSLLFALFPFLVVSSLLIRTGAAEAVGILLRPAALLMGVYAPAAGEILLLALVGGFAPAVNAIAEGMRARRLTPQEAERLLPACVMSGPSFVILAVGRDLLGSVELGRALFLAQAGAGLLSAVLMSLPDLRQKNPVPRKIRGRRGDAIIEKPMPLSLVSILSESTLTYLRLCGFILYFRLLSAGLSAAAAPISEKSGGWAVWIPILCEVTSGCLAASQTGRYAGYLCAAALSLCSASMLMQVRALCPEEISFRRLYAARPLHLLLTLGLLRVMLPRGVAAVFRSLPEQLIPIWHIPPDCLLLCFAALCGMVCRLNALRA